MSRVRERCHSAQTGTCRYQQQQQQTPTSSKSMASAECYSLLHTLTVQQQPSMRSLSPVSSLVHGAGASSQRTNRYLQQRYGFGECPSLVALTYQQYPSVRFLFSLFLTHPSPALLSFAQPTSPICGPSATSGALRPSSSNPQPCHRPSTLRTGSTPHLHMRKPCAPFFLQQRRMR